MFIPTSKSPLHKGLRIGYTYPRGTSSMRSPNGVTFVELLITTAILAVIIIGCLQLFIYSATQAEMTGNLTAAVAEAQSKIEEIRNHNYSAIAADYASGGTPGNTFNLTQLTGKGIIYIDSANAPCHSELLCVEIDVSWRNRYNRVIGEDTDLDGVLDGGEDVNGNGKLDSPAKLMTMITRK